MNKNFLSLLDTLSALLIGGFLVKVGMDGKANEKIKFFETYGLRFIEWFGSVLIIYTVGYFFPKNFRFGYFSFVTVILLTSKLGTELMTIENKIFSK